MSVAIDIVRGRIWMVSNFATPGLGKDIPGASFSTKPHPHWSIPLTFDACLALRERFGRSLEIGPDLLVWAKAEKQRRQEMADLGRATDAELVRLPEVSPVLAGAMASRTYQRAAAKFVKTGRNVLIADQPGLGKTLEAIGGIIESGVAGPYLVVTPKTAVQSVWAREIPRWWPGSVVVTVPDGRAKRDEILWQFVYGPEVYDGQATADTEEAIERYRPKFERTFLVVHPEMVRTKSWWVCGYVHEDEDGTAAEPCGVRTAYRTGPKQLDCLHAARHAPLVNEHDYPELFTVDWGAIVMDESDRILVRKTGKPTQARRGAELLETREDGLRIAMSGTPFRSRPHLLWGTLNWLEPTRYTSFWRWVETYYATESGWGGSKKLSEPLPDMNQKMDAELNGIMLRRTKAEVAPDMPAKTYIGTQLVPDDKDSPVGVWLPMSPEQERLYKQMSEQSFARMDGGMLNAIGILAEMTRMKQFANSCGRTSGNYDFIPKLPSNKFDYIVELCSELGIPEEPETKLVVVSQFTELLGVFAQELEKALKAPGITAMLTGEVTGRRREETIDAFNQPAGYASDYTANPHVLFLNVKAGGVAITLDTADHMVIVDETWIPDDLEQAEDRIHRVSRPRPVFYHYLRSMGSIDEHIAWINAERRANSAAVLDGRRGVDTTAVRSILSRMKGR